MGIKRAGRFRITLAVCLSVLAGAAYGQTPDDLQRLYAEGELQQVITIGQHLLRTTPDDAALNLLVGRALVDTEAFADALTYLERAVEQDTDASWITAWALTYLGRAYFAVGQTERSRDALVRAVRLQATPSATRSAQGWLRTFGFDAAFDDWQTRESAHFIFHFSPLLHAHPLARYVDEHEQAYSVIVVFFGARMPKKIDFFVWDSNQEAGRAGLPSLGFARPEVSLVHARFEQTVGHEMTHVLSHHGVRPAAKTGFINEGTAVCFDQRTADRMSEARTAVKAYGQDVSVQALWEDWEAAPAEVSYPLAGAFVEFLIREGGGARFLKLFRNQTIEHAWEVYGDDLVDLMVAFEIQLDA